MRINQRIVSTNDNSVNWLIVAIDDTSGMIAVSDLNAVRPRRPTVLAVSDVIRHINANRWALAEHEFPAALYVSDSKMKEIHLAKQLAHHTSAAKSKSKQLRDPLQMRDEAWSALSPLLSDPAKLHTYLYGHSAGIVSELMSGSNRSKKYITSNLNAYFYYGSIKNALLPKYFWCGSEFTLPQEPVRLDDGSFDLSSKPGQKVKYGAQQYRHVTAKDIIEIKVFLKKNLKNRQQVKLSYLYDEYVYGCCSVAIRPENMPDDEIAVELRMPLPKNHRLSPRAFSRQVKKIVPRLEWIRKQVGAKSYLRDHAAKVGVAKHGLRGATSRYEIDSTVLDAYVRWEFSPELLAIGRPIFYIVIDVVTGMIVGMHLAFHGPDWIGASQALFNAFTDKVAFCREYGLRITNEDWPCHHTCREITFDRGGENTDGHIEAMLKAKIGIAVSNLNAYYQGSAKGTVEQSFRTTQDDSLKLVLGQVIKIKNHDLQHASRTAIYTYQQIMLALIKCILHANNSRVKTSNRTFEMERDGVQFTPRDAWNYSLANTVIAPAQIAEDYLRFALLPEDNASIQSRGVYYKGLFYSSASFERLPLIEEAKNFGRKPIKIRYSSTSTNSIWWQEPDSQTVYKLDLTERSEAYKNITWASVLHRLEILKHELAEAKERQFISKIMLLGDLKLLEKVAKNRSYHLKRSKAKSPAQGMKDRYQLSGDMQKNQLDTKLQQTFAEDEAASVERSVKKMPWGNPNVTKIGDE
ncbi:transposase [Shewanella avicenniae]|uniref:Transposase n=1 Tax=Shewanella avicenniae TaxID=2814294 RepID=A0ABX7QUD9_9GAMM|nr:transposase [Shewanella avicenniae]QSX34468.1 transposase [Shewanella avicenniae]